MAKFFFASSVKSGHTTQLRDAEEKLKYLQLTEKTGKIMLPEGTFSCS